MIIGFLFSSFLIFSLVYEYKLLTYDILGLIWPMEGAHPMLRVFNRFLPLSVASETIGYLTLKGWPLQHPMVLRSFMLTILWLIIFAFPVVFFSSLKKDTWVK